MLVALYSPKGTYDARFLANYAYINLKDQLTRVKGVGTVQVFGAGPIRHAPLGEARPAGEAEITVPEIVSAIQTQNTVNPAGQVGSEPIPTGQAFTYSVRAQGRLTSPEEFEQIVVRETPETGIVRVQRRGAGGIGLAGLQRHRPPQRQAERRRRGLSVAGLQRRRHRRRRAESCSPRRSSVFPATWTTSIPVDTTRAVNEGIKEIVETLLIAIAAGGRGGLPVPAGLARHLDSAAGRAGIADRHVRVLPAVRLQHQYAVSVRPGAGDRPGGGRRHRRGGSRGAPHRGRPAPKAGGPQGHGGDLRAR